MALSLPSTHHLNLTSDKIGDSIAVNGICLTATEIKGTSFTADVSKETLNRTNLGKLKTGSDVNIERALKVGDRLGGHFVTGHIDGPGKVKRVERRGESLHIEINIENDKLRYVVEKGSITIDGISLTVNSVEKRVFYSQYYSTYIEADDTREILVREDA